MALAAEVATLGCGDFTGLTLCRWGDVDGWEYVMMSGAVQPVYTAVQALREQYFPS